MVGSQIVGLIPLKAVLDCADFYIQREKLFIIEEEHKVRLVSNLFDTLQVLLLLADVGRGRHQVIG